MRLKYEWRARHRDGTVIDELKPDGSGRPITDIDQSQLSVFELIDTETGNPHIIVEVRPGQKLIHRRRVFAKFTIGMDPNGEPKASSLETERTIWLIGKHEKRRGVNIQRIFVVFEDGHILALDRWRDDISSLIQPILMPEEELLDDELQL